VVLHQQKSVGKVCQKTNHIKETLEQLLKNIEEVRKLIDKYQEKLDELN